MNQFEFEQREINWDKSAGLIPAIIQDTSSGTVLMLGFMNPDALQVTLRTGNVTFYSRSKQRLWVKGETSGHYLSVVDMTLDCDCDTLLISTVAAGPTCHSGAVSCFQSSKIPPWQVLPQLTSTIIQRAQTSAPESYTATLLNAGLNTITQKVGEEAVETVIAGLNENDEKLCNETADLLYHTLVLLKARGLSLNQVLAVLAARLGCAA